MRKKMNFQDVIDIFQPTWMDNIPDTNDSNRTSGATRKGHKHNHNPSRKPSVVAGKFFHIQSPAMWRRAHMSKIHKQG